MSKGAMVASSNALWVRLLPSVAVLCTAILLLTACGGGSSVNLPTVTTYGITATAETGGTISPASATVDSGGTTSFTVTPGSGYAISGVTGCGGTLTGATYTTGTVTASCVVSATFVAQYTVTSTPGSGGTVTPASAMVDAAGTATFTITPNAGYVISGVTGCGGSLSGSTYTTGTINANCTVTASFSPAFTWMWGAPSSVLADGVYGTQGVAATTNSPGQRDQAAAWTDTNGDLWLFGGEGTDSKGSMAGELNDLWRYSPSSGEWTWVGGSNTANATGVYGTQGVAAAANVPGGRHGPAYWTDANGNLWLFGGWFNAGRFEHMNDLWKYSPSSGEWTWVGGSNTPNAKGIYGTQGVAAATSMPGGRCCAAAWTDTSGDVWLFGGEGYDSAGTYGWLNDLWKYSPSSGDWTWVGGSDTTQATGNYGSQGVAAATNIPGARAYEGTWTDANGNLWLFGGVGYDYTTSSYFYFNDLWEYSPSSGEWTWVSGSSTVNATGVYGTQGMAAATNVPGARAVPSSTWTDAGGNLWLLGGYWQNSNGSSYSYFNDLWEFSPSSGDWIWVGGANTPDARGVYGTQGVAAAANVPGARVGRVSWKDANGNVWIFGGSGYDSTGTLGDLNDLWKYPTK